MKMIPKYIPKLLKNYKKMDPQMDPKMNPQIRRPSVCQTPYGGEVYLPPTPPRGSPPFTFG